MTIILLLTLLYNNNKNIKNGLPTFIPFKEYVGILLIIKNVEAIIKIMASFL